MLSFRNLMWVRRRFCSVIKTALAVIVALACLAPSELSAKVKWSKKRPTIRSLFVRKSVPATPFSTVVIDAGHGGFDLPAYVVIESVFRHLAACFAHHWCVENSDLCSQLVIQLVASNRATPIVLFLPRTIAVYPSGLRVATMADSALLVGGIPVAIISAS